MNKLRAKFRVESVREVGNGAGGKAAEEIQMQPVYSSNPESENYSFSKATPSGEVRLFITNPDAFGFYKLNEEHYVDFSPASS